MRTNGVIDSPVGLGYHDHPGRATRPLVGWLLSLMSLSSVEVTEA